MKKLKRTRDRLLRGDKLFFQVAQLHYEGRWSKTAIAGRLGVSVTHVARLLREAAAQGIVRISVTAPRQVALEDELASKFGLRDVRVIPAPADPTMLRSHLGREAARLFCEIAQPGTKIGIGSGRTIYELVSALPQRPTPVSIFPLALIVDQSTEVRSVDAMTLVTTLWFKFRPDARALRMSMTFPGVPLEKIRSLRTDLFSPGLVHDLNTYFETADAFFFSASQPRKDSQIVDITRELGIDVPELRERGAVGDFLFRPVDAEGVQIDVGVEPFVLGIPLELLKRASEEGQKPVVLVAGGKEKVSIIRAGLAAHYFNTLITDDETASMLLTRARGQREGEKRGR